jgi:hypothetical protein
MTRALCFVVALAACGGSRPGPAPPRDDKPWTPSDEDETPSPRPDAGAAAGSGSATTDSSATTPPTSPGESPAAAAAHCLYIGPEQRVVRCYWRKKDCEDQITFNKETGLEKSQQCKGVAETHCFVSDKSERCYPDVAECEKNVAGIRQRNREATDCVAKTQP